MILVNEPLLNGNEKKYLNECIDTGWISSEGRFVDRLEREFAQYIGKKYGIAVCNGTAALEVALHAVGVKEGDEVIMPSFTIISCALAVLRLGARPVLVDIEPETWNMDVDRVASRITKKTTAIMPVHIYGHPVDMEPILELSKIYGLTVVEDAAEAHGAEYKARKCGSMGNVSAFSFYPNKLITTGEGGIVLCDDKDVANKASAYRNLYFGKEERFNHEGIGFNYRMSNLQAAIGVAQLERIDDIVDFKREMGRYYHDKLSLIDGIRAQTEKEWAKTVYWMYCIEVDENLGIDAKYIMAALRKRGIGTRPFFKGLHTQSIFTNNGLFVGEKYENTDKAYKYGLYLPSGMTLTKAQIDVVVESLREIVEGV